MEQELATLTRTLAVRDPVPLIVGDDGDRAIANEAHELFGIARDRALARIRTLTAALARMDAGVYGFCELCEKPIAPRRLEVMPETPFCVECSASLERDARRPAPGRRVADDLEDD